MKILKLLLINVFIATLLPSCGSAKIISTPIDKINNTAIKILPLTYEEELVWSHLDLVKDTVPGMSINKAYDEIIKDKKGQTVVVAVIDSGIDIDHEDLKGSIWVNHDEVPGNNTDDDANGYIDDIHGWNFLGEGYKEQFEYVRLLVSGNADDPDYARALAEYNKEFRKNTLYKNYYENILRELNVSDKIVAGHLKKTNYTRAEFYDIESDDEYLLKHMALIKSYLADDFNSVNEIRNILNHDLDIFNEHLNFHLNKGLKGRKTEDDPNDFSQTSYGNANVKPLGPDESHGTHVAGIIAAKRHNGLGVNGVVQNVKIMGLRAVPDGDEYDKDIALAIRYAADNGAKIINMSFGKYYSPHNNWVQEAILYAEQNDVLIVSGAGNQELDLDKKINYPNDQGKNTEISNNFLTVGATEPKYGSNLIANYSNYGKTNVDVFAPGSKIHSTYPENKYKTIDGTSMASPAVAGIAALIRSYYPNLSASQVKEIIMDSGLPLKSKVVVGGDMSNVKSFGDLSKSSKLVNAYNALIMADRISN